MRILLYQCNIQVNLRNTTSRCADTTFNEEVVASDVSFFCSDLVPSFQHLQIDSWILMLKTLYDEHRIIIIGEWQHLFATYLACIIRHR